MGGSTRVARRSAGEVCSENRFKTNFVYLFTKASSYEVFLLVLFSSPTMLKIVAIVAALGVVAADIPVHCLHATVSSPNLL